MEAGENGFQVLRARREQALAITDESNANERRLIPFNRRSFDWPTLRADGTARKVQVVHDNISLRG